MAAQKPCGRDIVWTTGGTEFKYDRMIFNVLLVIWLILGKKTLNTKWLTAAILLNSVWWGGGGGGARLYSDYHLGGIH